MVWDHVHNNINEWSTPCGLIEPFKKLGYIVETYGTHKKGQNKHSIDLSLLINNIDKYEFILIMNAGGYPELNREIKRLKQYNKKIILEAGDEPQTYYTNQEVITLVDAFFTPDMRCYIHYKQRGFQVFWITHWGDESIYQYDKNVKKENKIVTTCGDRMFTSYIKSQLGDVFENKRISPDQCKQFYNSGTICFQQANNDEITRRIFEAGGCKLAVITNKISPETDIYKLFIENEDILYYSHPDEAIEKLKLLLSDEKLRNKLSNNLYNKVQKYHRCINRCQQILDVYENITNM